MPYTASLVIPLGLLVGFAAFVLLSIAPKFILLLFALPPGLYLGFRIVDKPFLGLVISILLIPLEAVGRVIPSYSAFTYAKLFLVVTTLSWLLNVLIKKKSVVLPPRSWLLGLFIVVTLISAFRSFNVADCLYSTALFAVQCLILVLIYNLIRTEKEYQYAIGAIIFTSIFVSVLGLYEVHIGTSYFKTVDEQFYGSATQGLRRITSTFYDPNALGRYLVFVLCMTFQGFFIFSRPFTRPLLAGIMLLQFCCLVNTFSRGSLAALCVCIVLALFSLPTIKAKFYTLFVSVVLLLSAVAFDILPHSYIEAFLERLTLVIDISQLRKARLDVFEYGLGIFSNFPVWGIGLGAKNIASAYDYFYDIYFAPHSLYLEVLLSSGIIGFICLSAFVSFLLYRAWFSTCLDLRMRLRVSALPLVGIIISSLSLHGIKANEIWIALGLIAVLVRHDMERGCSEDASALPEPSISSSTVAR